MAAESMTLGTTADSQPVNLNVEALIGSHLCIQANAGGGKSRTIRKILELAEGHAQRIVLDVEDEFHTLREASPRMVIAGPDGDCPANLANAAALPLFLLETGVDAVIQINQLGLEGRRQFIALFLSALIGAPRRLWHPALVVLDETHRYAPQAGKEASSDAVAALASEGRKRGFTAIFATQRMAKIDKDSTGDVNNWLMGRAGQAVDRARCAEELGLKPTGADIRGMGRLSPGHFWTIGPALCPDPVLIHVGDVKTTHLRSGQRGVPVPPGASEIRAMMAKLHIEPAPAAPSAAAAPAQTSQAGEKINATPRPADKAELAAEYQRGFGEGEVRGFAAGDAAGFARCEALVLANMDKSLQCLAAQEDNATAAREHLTDLKIDMRNAAPTTGIVLSSSKPVAMTTVAPQKVKAPVAERSDAPAYKANGKTAGSSPAGGTTDIGPTARKVLDVIHAAYPVAISYAAAATRAGVSKLSSKYRAYRQQVIDSGEVEQMGDKLCSGRRFAKPVRFEPGQAVEGWAQRLPPNAANILRAIAHLGTPNRDQIGERAGISLTSSGLDKGIRDLRNLELIEASDAGRFSLCEALRA